MNAKLYELTDVITRVLATNNTGDHALSKEISSSLISIMFELKKHCENELIKRRTQRLNKGE